MPAPQRGEIVRQLEKTTRKQRGFRKIGFLRNGKSLQEGYGEVQEMIDICDCGGTFPSTARINNAL
jgi:aldehyde dehydrogenase (NAD+)